MPEIEITCQYVNFPKEGKRRGSIKTSEGVYYWTDAAMLKRFSVGEVCTIEYDTAPKDGGGEWRTIKRKISTSTAPPQAQFRHPTAPKDSIQIFVTALLKGMVTPQDTQASVIAKGNMLKAAYQNLFGTEAKQTTEAQFNDEIPDKF
jgi:hypothetical protein